MSKKIEWLDRCLFVSPVYYCLCKTEKEFKKVQKHLKIPKNKRTDFLLNGSNTTAHFFTKDNDSSAVVCIDGEGYSRSQVSALLAHEAVHIFQEVKYIVGEDNPSKEFEAYAIQAISQRLFESYYGD